MNKLIFFNFFLWAAMGSEAYKILGVFPHPGRSHFLVFKPLMEALAARGHEVTVLSYFPTDGSRRNYKDLVLKFPEGELIHIFDLEQNRGAKLLRHLGGNLGHHYEKETCRFTLNTTLYKDLLKSDQEFDLIISEYFFHSCVSMPLLEKFKVPFVGITSHVLMPWTNDWVANPSNPAFVPALFLGFADKMSFFERLENTVYWAYSRLYQELVADPEQYEIIKSFRGPDDAPLRKDLMYDTSLIFTYTHFSLNLPRPLVPNVVEVGGMHIGQAKKLPGNLEKWINESTHGVIYFSLGSMIKGHTFPEEKRQMFLRAFSRLPQRVLWKWETETMPGKPDNVLLQKWMPQFDILCHPNVKAFIAHGGLLGATEAVHCGVPMVVMPQFGDQFTNAKAVEASGGGVILDFRYLTEENIYDALKTVLEPSFNKKAKELSERFRDRPLPPLDTAIYWVEYVARHGGAPHLRTAAVGMPLYQYLLLDVVAFLLLVISIIAYINYRLFKAIFGGLFKSKTTPKIKKN